MGSSGGCNINKGLVTDDEERRLVAGKGFAFAPVPEFAQDGQGRAAQEMAAFEAPDGVGVGGLPGSAIANEAGAGFLVPIEAAFGFEFFLELVGQGLQIMSIVPGVFFHLLGQGPKGPIGLLGAFFELNTQVVLDEVHEAELTKAQEAGRQHSVEDCGGDELVMFAEQTQVVVCPMHNQFVGRERFEEGAEVEASERIHQVIAGRSADLDQTDFFWIGVKAVSFGIDRDPGRSSQFLQK